MLDTKITVAANALPDIENELTDSLHNNIFLSLTIERGACFWNPQFGCRLYLIKKITAESMRLAEQYCAEALKWLVDIKRVTEFDIVVERDPVDQYRMNIGITAHRKSGTQFETSMHYSIV
jgi:phage gp46-like protein